MMILLKHIRCGVTIKIIRCRSSLSSKQENTRKLLDKILRVDHAGEFGAVRIYLGQLAVLKNTPKADIIEEMLEQEKFHLSSMENKMKDLRVRPTILLPVWNIAGFLLGASTAALGNEAAMACTVAVETAIGEHYDSQLRELIADKEKSGENHDELIKMISKFRDEELEHLDTGLSNHAEQAPLYDVLSFLIKNSCKCAIWISEKI